MNDDIFSFDNFKRWIKDQKEFDPKIKKKFPIGEQVESKVSSKKFANVMTLEDGQMNRVVKDFMKNGGKIKEVSGKEFLIEVTMGSFYIAKNYVRRGWSEFFLIIVEFFVINNLSSIWLYPNEIEIWCTGIFSYPLLINDFLNSSAEDADSM